MKMPRVLLFALTLPALAGGALTAQPPSAIEAAAEQPPESQGVDQEAIHDALRALKRGAEETFNRLGTSGDRKDLEALLEYVHPDIVLMPMNGAQLVGKEGIFREFERTMTGPARTVASMHHTFDVAALSILHGNDTAVAYGTTHGTYELTSGLGFEVDANWTATMVEEDGRWTLASFQFAPSIFNNPLVKKARGMVTWVGVAAATLGLLVGLLLGRLTGRRRAGV